MVHNETEDYTFALCIRSASDLCTALSEILDIDCTTPVLWQDEETQESCIYVYTEDETQLEKIEKQVVHTCRQCADFLPEVAYEITRITIPHEEWAESWKKYFHASRVSTHFIIAPSWENVTQETDDVIIRIDPGMAFGTGLHGTTRGCLELMEPFFFPKEIPDSFADIGCGSGILSIAAALSGCENICAYDIDPVAIDVTRENCALNNVSKNVSANVLNVYHWQPENTFQLVCANILANVLEDNCKTLVQCVEQGGSLILSGMLSDQAPTVLEKYASLGLTKQGECEIDGWVTLLLS